MPKSRKDRRQTNLREGRGVEGEISNQRHLLFRQLEDSFVVPFSRRGEREGGEGGEKVARGLDLPQTMKKKKGGGQRFSRRGRRLIGT